MKTLSESIAWAADKHFIVRVQLLSPEKYQASLEPRDHQQTGYIVIRSTPEEALKQVVARAEEEET